MGTGAKFLSVSDKKILGYTDIGTRIFDYLKNLVEEANKAVYDGSYFYKDGVSISADGTDRIKITEDSAGVIGTDGEGHQFDIDQTTKTGIYFENASTIVYYVGLKYCYKPVGITINPRNNQPQYVEYEDQIGEQADPTSVTDNGTNITFNVNSICESGVDHKNRTCLVYKKVPASGATSASIAIESCTVTYSSPNNTITTTGLLGQSTVSTTASDYSVVILGPTVKRNTDLRSASGYTFIGTVTGAGAGVAPSTFSHTDQKVVEHSWTDILFDGFPADFLPSTDSTYDIGSSAVRWANGYFDDLYTGDLEITNMLTLSTVTIDGSLNPYATETYDIGSSSVKWRDIHGRDLFGRDFELTGNVNSNLIPKTDDTYDLGDTTYKWNYALAYNVIVYEELSVASGAGDGVDSDFVPAINKDYDLGNSSYLWHEIYINELYMDTGTGAGVFNHFEPRGDATYSLGSAAFKWDEAWITVLELDATVGGGVDSDFKPYSDNTYDLGSSSYHWNNSYIDDLNLGVAAGEGIGTNLKPTVTSMYSIGGSTYYFADVYSENVYYKTDLSTFDSEDDLALIDAFEPTDNFEIVNKAGKDRKIFKANSSSLPWPILGPKDPTKGDYFIDSADSVMFILGAIKQLHRKIVQENEELKKRLEILERN